MSYHAQNGLWFNRLEDGGVHVHYEDGAGLTLSENFSPQAWASIVAAMEAGGENAESFYAALSRQTGVQHDPATGGEVDSGEAMDPNAE